MRGEVGYKVLIGNSPEKNQLKGLLCLTSEVARACESEIPKAVSWDNCSLAAQQLSHCWWMFPSVLSRSSSLLNHHVTAPTRSAEKALWKYFHFPSKLCYAWLSNAQLWFGHEHGSLHDILQDPVVKTSYLKLFILCLLNRKFCVEKQVFNKIIYLLPASLTL